jgi:chromate transporter
LAVGALVMLAARLLTLLEVVGVAAVIGVLVHGSEPPSPPRIEGDPSRSPPAATGLLPIIVAGVPVALSLSLFGVFAKIGIATFGGGYAMIPSIAHEVVAQRGWLDDHTFGDAIALGNVTPGPIAISATFIGYRVGGLAGALAATLGIFGPPFVLAVATARSIEAFRASRLVSGALRGVSPAVVGIIAAAAYALTRSTVHSWFGAGLAVASLAMRIAFPRSSPAVPLVLSALVSVAVRAWLGAA